MLAIAPFGFRTTLSEGTRCIATSCAHGFDQQDCRRYLELVFSLVWQEEEWQHCGDYPGQQQHECEEGQDRGANLPTSVCVVQKRKDVAKPSPKSQELHATEGQRVWETLRCVPRLLQ